MEAHSPGSYVRTPPLSLHQLLLPPPPPCPSILQGREHFVIVSISINVVGAARGGGWGGGGDGVLTENRERGFRGFTSDSATPPPIFIPACSISVSTLMGLLLLLLWHPWLENNSGAEKQNCTLFCFVMWLYAANNASRACSRGSCFGFG